MHRGSIHNHTLHHNLHIDTVEQIIRKVAFEHEKKLRKHVNVKEIYTKFKRTIKVQKEKSYVNLREMN